MDIIKNYHDKKWTLQFLDALYNSIDYTINYLLDGNCFWQNMAMFSISSQKNNIE
jgi:hypothetical protein